MKSLFNKEHAQQFIDRLNTLNYRTQPQWGKMDVAQMVTHCQMPIKVATGELIPTVNPIVRYLFGRRAKKELLNDPEFKKHLPTFAEAKITGKREFEKERSRLIESIEKFQENGPGGLTKDPHPFFGEMTVGDWDIWEVKHLDHHLRQFGV
jgi:hypothetical protein